MGAVSAHAVNALIFEFFSSLEEYRITTMEDLDAKVLLVDDIYSTVTRDAMLAIAGSNPLNVPPGTPKTDLTDCDDYALQLKTMAAATARQLFIVGEAEPLPPAIGMVICKEHVITLFVEQDEAGVNSLCFLDASTRGTPVAHEPEEAARLMKTPPVKLIYM
jgi:hypothetical protein